MKPSVSINGEYVFQLVSLLAISLAMLTLCVLLLDIMLDGVPKLNVNFLTGFPSRRPAEAGIAPALAGSAFVMLLVVLFTVPLGVGAAVYLEEYSKKNLLSTIIELNIANLAGVPSIIYGILGLELFVRFFALERSVLAGALTLSLLVLPIVIISTREAIRRVPNSIREAAVALGATRLEVVIHHVLPLALPGIITGCIFAFARAIGEAAPLITMGALTYMAFLPDSIFSPFTVLPIQAFNWISRPQTAFHESAAGAIVVLLVLLMVMNFCVVWLRVKYEKRFIN